MVCIQKPDIYRLVGRSDLPQATSTLDPDETMVSGIPTPHSGVQQATFISESGLYALIMKSRTPQAKAFRKFVTNEVLPAIRKHGA